VAHFLGLCQAFRHQFKGRVLSEKNGQCPSKNGCINCLATKNRKNMEKHPEMTAGEIIDVDG
jgi:hypothetical protein